MMIHKLKSIFPQNLRELYFEYGGAKALLKSGYFYIALLLTALSWRFFVSKEDQWIDLALTVSPTLAGFSLAMFALLFAILDPETRKILREPDEGLNGRSPLLAVASKIIHAVLIQLSSIVVAIVYFSKPFILPETLINFVILGNILVSFLGVFLLFYGITLVFATCLTIFTLFVLSK